MGAVPSKGLTGFLYSENCKTTELTENLSTEEPLHRSYDVEVKISNLLVTSEDKKLMQSCSKEPVGCIDIDLCAPDTLDFVQENTPDSAPNELDKNAYNETACEITSGDLLNAENEEMLRSNSNPSSEKRVYNYPSNMLPSQVNSKDEQNKIGYSLDVPSSDVIMIEAAHGEQGEKIHGYTDPHSNTSNSEHMKSIVPDSFENSQGLDFKDKPQNCDVCIPESVLDDMSPKDLIISERSDDTCSDLKENPVHVGLSFVQKDLSTAQDFTGGVSNAFSGVKTKSCQLESTETLAEMTQDEVVGKTGNAETMIMSSKLPKLVYTRKKLRNAIPFQENCSVMECAEYEKFKLVTPEMYTAKDTLPPSETIVINNSNDKSCEPKYTGLCVETPQTHGDVLGGHSNLVEPNPSSQNPTLFADENKCFGTKEAQLISEPMSLQNQELKNNLGSSVKFVGCYLHPMPVSSLFLSTREDEIHVCVLCGHLTGQCRTLFTYKVAITEPSIGCPSVMAHSSILLPDPNITS
ncbi:hypothetical protein E2542_SST15622 [Spatholobus suberectus]|nr:hypothetical protein E2542_SST15622 [Spatholobus suberectus]